MLSHNKIIDHSHNKRNNGTIQISVSTNNRTALSVQLYWNINWIQVWFQEQEHLPG